MSIEYSSSNAAEDGEPRHLGLKIPNPPHILHYGVEVWNWENFVRRHNIRLPKADGPNAKHVTIGEIFTSEVANSDGIVFKPTADLFHLSGMIDEQTVGNHLFCHTDNSLITAKDVEDEKKNRRWFVGYSGTSKDQLIDGRRVSQSDFESAEGHKKAKKSHKELGRRGKPFVLCGSAQEWKWFTDILQTLKEGGLLRFEPDSLPRVETPDNALAYLKQELEIPSIRRHQRHNKVRQLAPIVYETFKPGSEEAPHEKISVAYFGSAGTKDKHFLNMAKKVAEFAVDSDWNIVHGGGYFGVMGALTEAAHAYAEAKGKSTHVTGVTVDGRYAPAIRKEGTSGEEQDHRIVTRDMTTRMLCFGNSDAFVILPGGIGTLHELMQLATDKAQGRDYMQYEEKGTRRNHQRTLIGKPIVLVEAESENQTKIWKGVIEYIERHPTLKSAITVVPSVEECQAYLTNFFIQHPHCEKQKLGEKLRQNSPTVSSRCAA